MVNYAAPTTPTRVLELEAAELRTRAGTHRREADLRLKLAEECEAMARELESSARRYSDHQPDPDHVTYCPPGCTSDHK